MGSLMELSQRGLIDGWAIGLRTGRLSIALWTAWYCLEVVFSLLGKTNSSGEFAAAAPVTTRIPGTKENPAETERADYMERLFCNVSTVRK